MVTPKRSQPESTEPTITLQGGDDPLKHLEVCCRGVNISQTILNLVAEWDENETENGNENEAKNENGNENGNAKENWNEGGMRMGMNTHMGMTKKRVCE